MRVHQEDAIRSKCRMLLQEAFVMVNVPYLEAMPMKKIGSIALFGTCCIYLTNALGSGRRETCDGG